MKAIGIIGAMEEEITVLKSKMKIHDTKEAAGSVYYEGYMLDKKIVLVKSGVGKVNAAICTQILINLFEVGCVINVGVAGGIYKNLKIGDTVISTDVVHHDFDSVIFGLPSGAIPFMAESFFKADSRLVEIATKSAKAILKENNIYTGRIASGDQFIADKDVKEKIKSIFGALCVEMEGAAIAQAAYLNNIPFVIMRAISDNADDDAHISFSKFLESSALNTADIVEDVIRSL